MTVNSRIVFQRNTQIIASDMGDEIVIVSLQQDNYYALRQVSVRIWKLLEQPMSLEDLCATLRREYNVDEATCLRDVSSLLETLTAEGLVQALPQ